MFQIFNHGFVSSFLLFLRHEGKFGECARYFYGNLSAIKYIYKNIYKNLVIIDRKSLIHNRSVTFSVKFTRNRQTVWRTATETDYN